MEEDNKVININDKKGLNIEDICYRLEEMSDAMQNSIDNIDKINNQQGKLIEIIANVEKDIEEDKKEFKEFIEETKEQCENLNSQKSSLFVKKEILTQIVDKCKEDKEVSKYISMLAYVIGLFKN